MARRAAAVLVLFVGVASAACGDDDRSADDRGRPVAEAGDAAGGDDRTVLTGIRPVAGLPSLVVRPTGRGPYPLVVFVHGAGAAPVYYADLLEDLAAEGHVVVAPAMPGSVDDAGPGALLALPFQPGRVAQVIDAVSAGPERIPIVDPGRVAVAGHSLGGMTALATAFHSCCSDRRVDAVVSYAGQLAGFPGGAWGTGLVPTLLVHGAADDTVAYTGSREALRAVGTSAHLLTVLDGDHGGYLAPTASVYGAVRDATLGFLLATVGGDPQAGLAHLRAAGAAAGVRLERRL